jgi:hypothetical protein
MSWSRAHFAASLQRWLQQAETDGQMEDLQGKMLLDYYMPREALKFPPLFWQLSWTLLLAKATRSRRNWLPGCCADSDCKCLEGEIEEMLWDHDSVKSAAWSFWCRAIPYEGAMHKGTARYGSGIRPLHALQIFSFIAFRDVRFNNSISLTWEHRFARGDVRSYPMGLQIPKFRCIVSTAVCR